MQPNLPFLSAASNANLMPGGLLKWKKRLMKDVRLSLLLTQVMKFVRLTSTFFDVHSLSSPRPRLRYGWRPALLLHLNLTLNLGTLPFVLSLALFSHFAPLLNFSTFLLPGNRLRSSPII